jgi:hypothetical protein
MEESSQTFIITKLSLFRRLSIPPSMCMVVLAWWRTHKG